MTKTKPATATDPAAAVSGTAITTESTSILGVRPSNDTEANALAALDAAGIGGEDDGLSEVVPSDLRTPLKLYNLKQAEGVARITQDAFLDTIDKTVSTELNLVLLELHKSNLYAVFNNRDQRNVTMCSSFDRITGVMPADETTRPCKGCPDAVWRTELDQKTGEKRRTVPCSEVWTVAAFDLDAQRPCFIKFKKTSMDAIRNYLQANHIGKRALPGGRRGNIPLYAYRVRVTIGMHKGGNFAIPAIERGPVLSPADLKVMHETAMGIRETFRTRLDIADRDAGGMGSDGGEGGDTSFDPAAMSGAANDNGVRGTAAFVD